MKFYTHAHVRSNTVCVRGYKNGKRFVNRVEYNPTLFVPSRKPTEYQTLSGEYVEPLKMGSIKEAGYFAQKYEGVDNFKIYGSTKWAYVYLNEEFGNDYDVDQIRVANIDIEVASEDGFPSPELANQPVTAICISYTDKGKRRYYVIGNGEYTKSRDDVHYIDAKDEMRLLSIFLNFWERLDPDIITGWNIEGFDIPYLVNRISKILGEKEARRLSPFGWLKKKEIKKFQRIETLYELTGIATLDYLQLYKKFTYSQQESYRLDHIAFVELGERKLDYSEMENLHQLYKLDYQKFIDYNIKDVELVDKIEDKMKLIEMALAIAYDAKVNYTDTFTQVTMWDVLIHNYLMKKKIAIPPKEQTIKNSAFAGAYVKNPQVGMHNWVMSFDLNSLYPHLIMQYNISPETMVEDDWLIDVNVDDIIDRKTDTHDHHSMAANGRYFRKDKQGFLPEMMERMYNERKGYKKKMLESQTELEMINKRLAEL
jgi:DNA polymerase elongation subunit (family B)